MKFLFASSSCLLDPTSGAAISMRTMLSSLADLGHTVTACTATVMDSANGARAIQRLFAQQERPRQLLVHNAGVKHFLTPTSHWARAEVTAAEMERLDEHFKVLIERDRPDVVISYGGMVSERHMLAQARRAGITTAFMLVNPSYHHSGYFADVDHVFTDTPTTARLYKERLNLEVTPLGRMLDPSAVVAKNRDPKFVTFINPSFDKGVNLVARLALMCRDALPEIKFLVVESRGQWEPSLEVLGLRVADLPNVSVIPTQADMRSIYAQTKILLVPSMWFESGARVGVEAIANGIPVLVESEGGTKDLLGGGAVVIDIPKEARDARRTLMSEEQVMPWYMALAQLFRDEAYFGRKSAQARAEASRLRKDEAAQNFLSLIA